MISSSGRRTEKKQEKKQSESHQTYDNKNPKKKKNTKKHKPKQKKKRKKATKTQIKECQKETGDGQNKNFVSKEIKKSPSKEISTKKAERGKHQKEILRIGPKKESINRKYDKIKCFKGIRTCPCPQVIKKKKKKTKANCPNYHRY